MFCAKALTIYFRQMLLEPLFVLNPMFRRPRTGTTRASVRVGSSPWRIINGPARGADPGTDPDPFRRISRCRADGRAASGAHGRPCDRATADRHHRQHRAPPDDPS